MAQFLMFVAIVIVFNIIKCTKANSTMTNTGLSDPKHRKELVNEAFLEQKDVLLEMLEAKLKEVRDKKKKKALEKSENNSNITEPKSATVPKDQNLVMKANGISNIGVVNLLMSQGVSGKGHLKLDADGISNVGRAHLELEMEGDVNVPGISDSLIAAPPRLKNIFCDNQETTKDAVTDMNVLEVETHIEVGGLNEKSLRKTDINNTLTDANSTKLDEMKMNDDIEVRSNVTTSADITSTLVTGDVITTSSTSGSSAVTIQSNLNTVA